MFEPSDSVAADDLYYRYEPLAEGKIRLLQILPERALPECESDLEVSLGEFAVDEVKFDALSYTWGSSTLEEQEAAAAQVFTTVERCYPVIFQGRILRVTRSLRNLLRRLRAYSADPTEISGDSAQVWTETRSQYTWADGICINQDDLQERTEQVALMNAIYSRANLVLAFLGDEDEFTQGALKTIYSLQALKDHVEESTNVNYTESLFNDSLVFANAGAQHPTTSQWWAWAITLSRAWFQRTWVLQEAALGRERTLVMLDSTIETLERVLCGIKPIRHLTWVSALLTMLGNTSQTDQRYKRYYGTVDLWLKRYHPHEYISRGRESKQPVSLCQAALWVLPLTQSTDPRDKILGMMGFVSGLQSLQQGQFSVDYTMCVAGVYSRATKHVITQTGDLDLLSAVSVRSTQLRIDKLPSWCPNYNTVQSLPAPLNSDHPFLGGCSWLASGNSRSAAVDPEADVFYLNARGRLCDLVEANVLCEDNRWLCRDTLQLLVTLMERHDTPLSSSVLQSLFRCLVAFGINDISEERWDLMRQVHLFGAAMALLVFVSVTPSETLQQHQHAEDHVREIDKLAKDLLASDSEAADFLPNLDWVIDEVTMAKRDFESPEGSSGGLRGLDSRSPFGTPTFDKLRPMIRQMAAVTADRRVYYTKNHRLGLGHSGLRSGDQVWLLAGARIPFVLRQHEEGHMELIGETYIDGLMFGEMWPSDESELVDIVLK